MYVLSWRIVSALTRGLFWCLFPSLLRNSGNIHQNNSLVSAETVRHSSTYIIPNVLSGPIWRHRSGSSLAQITTRCPQSCTVPMLIYQQMWPSPESNFTKTTQDINPQNEFEFENYTIDIIGTFIRTAWVKYLSVGNLTFITIYIVMIACLVAFGANISQASQHYWFSMCLSDLACAEYLTGSISLGQRVQME